MSEISGLILKDNVRSWFYYHHKHTNPIKPKHFKYIECINWLASETSAVYWDEAPSFAQIRVSINELSKAQIEHLHTLQRQKI